MGDFILVGDNVGTIFKELLELKIRLQARTKMKQDSARKSVVAKIEFLLEGRDDCKAVIHNWKRKGTASASFEQPQEWCNCFYATF